MTTLTDSEKRVYKRIAKAYVKTKDGRKTKVRKFIRSIMKDLLPPNFKDINRLKRAIVKGNVEGLIEETKLIIEEYEKTGDNTDN